MKRVYERTDDGVVRPESGGMRVDSSVADKTSPVWVALGSRSPGTHVPRAAGFTPVPPKKKQGVVPSWMDSVEARPLGMVSVPAVTPLTAQEGDPETGAIGGDRVFVPYEIQRSQRVATPRCPGSAEGKELVGPPDASDGTGRKRRQKTIVATERYAPAAGWLSLEVSIERAGHTIWAWASGSVTQQKREDRTAPSSGLSP